MTAMQIAGESAQTSRQRPSNATFAARVLGAALLGATAAIHARLYTTGYSDIPTIGPLFLVNAVAASVLCLAVLLVRRRGSWLVTGAGAGLEVGTLAGLIISVQHGLFGFIDTTGAPLFWPSVAVETAGALILGVLSLAGVKQWLSQR